MKAKSKSSPAVPDRMTVADAHALADRLDAKSHAQDVAWAKALIRALLRGLAPGDSIRLEG